MGKPMIYPSGQRPPPFPQAGYQAHRSTPPPPCRQEGQRELRLVKKKKKRKGWVRTRQTLCGFPAVEIHVRLECSAVLSKQCQVSKLESLMQGLATSPHKAGGPRGSGDPNWHLPPLTTWRALHSELCGIVALTPHNKVLGGRHQLQGRLFYREGN